MTPADMNRHCSSPAASRSRSWVATKPGFGKTAIAIVEKHAGAIDAAAIRVAPSRNGKFVSVTITIDAQSQEQLDNIYRDLTDHDEVLFSL